MLEAIKDNEVLVRDVVNREVYSLFFYLKNGPTNKWGEKDELSLVKNLVKAVFDENTDINKEIEKVYRLGRHGKEK